MMQINFLTLKLLEACGVDNWFGYDEAMHEYYNNKEE